MWIPSEIKDRRGAFQTKHLALRNIAVFTVLVIAQKERVLPAIRLEALACEGDIVRRIDAKDAIDEITREGLTFGWQLLQRNPGKGAMLPLQLNARLHRSFFEDGLFSPSGIEAAEQTLPDEELVAIQIVR